MAPYRFDKFSQFVICHDHTAKSFVKTRGRAPANTSFSLVVYSLTCPPYSSPPAATVFFNFKKHAKEFTLLIYFIQQIAAIEWDQLQLISFTFHQIIQRMARLRAQHFYHSIAYSMSKVD